MPYNKLGGMTNIHTADNVTSDNTCIILTMDNIVEIMGSLHLYNYEANTTLFTVPTTYAPMNDIHIPVISSIPNVHTLTIASTGEISVNESFVNNILYTNGLCYNICDKYYNEQIGNNQPQYTSNPNWVQGWGTDGNNGSILGV